MNLKRLSVLLLLLLVFVSVSAIHAEAQKVETGFLNRALVVNGEEYRCQVYVPREFHCSIKWPVILALHGGGEYGNDGIRQTAGALASVIRRFPERVPAIVVFTQAHADGKPGWHDAEGRAALAAVDEAISEFSGDGTGSVRCVAKRVAHLPIWIFHGDADPTVPVEESRRMFAALKALGANVQYIEFPGVKHDAWNPAYERADLLEWRLKQRRR
jgi:predicted peptidase